MELDNETRRNDSYVMRMPSPPRLAIPPPSKEGCVAFLDQAVTSSQHQFIPLYDWQTYSHGPDPLDWRYESRRHAQMILPYLYLGPLTAARDTSFLTREGITMVLAIMPLTSTTSKGLAGALRTAADHGLDVQVLSVSNYEGLIPTFRQATALINKHVALKATPAGFTSAPNKVLVVCESGNERSATVVAAHIIDNFGCDVVQAVQVVHQRRFCVNIDDFLKNKLLTFKEILDARSMVARAVCTTPSITATNNSNSKRSLDRDSDEEMEVDDLPRFGNRSFSPFTGKTG